jgi:Mg2+ and Co2+ transporter CorA
MLPQEQPKPTSCEPNEPALTLTADACSLSAWQHFLLTSVLADDTQRSHMLAVLNINQPLDRIKQLTINSTANVPLAELVETNHKLLTETDNLKEPLRTLFKTHVEQNQRWLQAALETQAVSKQNAELQKKTEQLQRQLAQLQQKINALTEIEQQINDVKTAPEITEESNSE